jgi:hypothetical protein
MGFWFLDTARAAAITIDYDTKRAKDFAASPDLREMMAKAGVMDDPTIYFLESV